MVFYSCWNFSCSVSDLLVVPVFGLSIMGSQPNIEILTLFLNAAFYARRYNISILSPECAFGGASSGNEGEAGKSGSAELAQRVVRLMVGW